MKFRKVIRKRIVPILIIVGIVYGYQRYGAELLRKYSPSTKKQVDNVLGTTSKYITKQASSSAQAVSGFVFKKATEPLIQQINKLPPNQKEDLKKQICK